jgi:phosphoglycolate phosphatase-like HAD superfamily hydrolase
MAVTVVVFDVGETLVDEASTYARWEAEGVTDFAFAQPDLHGDALPCLAALRAFGLRLGAAGNMRAVHEGFLRPLVDFVGSSEKDVLPALAAGLHAVRIRRGAHAQDESPAGTVTIGSLDELPEVLPRV